MACVLSLVVGDVAPDRDGPGDLAGDDEREFGGVEIVAQSARRGDLISSPVTTSPLSARRAESAAGSICLPGCRGR